MFDSGETNGSVVVSRFPGRICFAAVSAGMVAPYIEVPLNPLEAHEDCLCIFAVASRASAVFYAQVARERPEVEVSLWTRPSSQPHVSNPKAEPAAFDTLVNDFQGHGQNPRGVLGSGPLVGDLSVRFGVDGRVSKANGAVISGTVDAKNRDGDSLPARPSKDVRALCLDAANVLASSQRGPGPLFAREDEDDEEENVDVTTTEEVKEYAAEIIALGTVLTNTKNPERTHFFLLVLLAYVARIATTAGQRTGNDLVVRPDGTRTPFGKILALHNPSIELVDFPSMHVRRTTMNVAVVVRRLVAVLEDDKCCAFFCGPSHTCVDLSLTAASISAYVDLFVNVDKPGREELDSLRKLDLLFGVQAASAQV